VYLQSITTEQKLPISLKETWEFLTNPGNLKLLTPDDLNMNVLYGNDRDIYPGQLIEYSLEPLPFYKTNWVTHITQVKEMNYFVDEQMYGPYATWHHKHFVTEIPGGTLMKDTVHYRLPFGIFGKIALPLVKKKLEEIFRFRESALIKHFGPYDENAVIQKPKDTNNNPTLKHEILN
jgi:ligand-binding SRPBCC domain-containing protein